MTTQTTSARSAPPRGTLASVPSAGGGIDPRGPRFGAALTVLVLAVALVAAPSGLTVGLLAFQVVAFGLGAGRGVQHTPYAWVFRTLVRPRLAPPGELEDPAPPRFAQGVGLGFAVLALAGHLAGASLVGSVFAGLALAAAFLNAVFGFCLGCELYLLGLRWSRGGRRGRPETA